MKFKFCEIRSENEGEKLNKNLKKITNQAELSCGEIISLLLRNFLTKTNVLDSK